MSQQVKLETNADESIVLEGWSTTSRNKKSIIKSVIDIDYSDSNYCYKKQVPMTASFLESFLFLAKNSGGVVLHAKKKVGQFPLPLAS